MQCIAKLFDVSVDYLLDDRKTLSENVIKEEIDISQYEKSGKCRSKFDAVAKAKFPNANVIFALIRRKKLNVLENIADFVVQPGVLQMIDSLNECSAYYLVELDNRQLLINVKKEFM